ncbi:D-alanyl-D-alanine carboxypeptidase family protein [Streptomyces sp. NPDC057743]|uniref:D-alanyl-D-alanine carboxypeptidase family protein n=1 Tax=Streptomyces sp. NPDC057743 TaxID=3346236 RepID=UPI0036790D28
MAGESPDKSDKKSGKEQSSGRTARTERDPRLTVRRDEEPSADGTDAPESGAKAAGGKGSGGKGSGGKTSGGKGEGDGTGKAAGAANGAKPKWAVKEPAKEAVEASGAAQDGAAGDAEGDPEAKSGEGAQRAKAPSGAKPAAAKKPKAPEKAGAEEKAESGAKAEPAEKAGSGEKAVDQATAVFTTVGAKAIGAQKGKGESPDEAPADDATRVFAVAKAGKLESSGEGEKAGETEQERPADRPTTTFKLGNSGNDGNDGNSGSDGKNGARDADKPVEKATKDTDEAAGKGTETDKGAGKGASASAAGGGAAKGDGSKADAPKSGEAKASSGEDKSDGGTSGDAKAKPADAKAADAKAGDTKSGDAKPGDAKAKAADVEEQDAERTSQFVALKPADDGSAERSIGKTAPKTPLRKPGSTSDADDAKDQDKQDKEAGASGDAKDATKDAKKAAGTAVGAAAGAGKSAEEPAGKPAGKPADKAEPAGKAPGAMPPAAAPDEPAGKPDVEKPDAAEAESERTRQEPLPPLDLLAKLTNTPPPPETPVRTLVRRVKIWTPLVALLVIIFAVVQAVRPLPDPKLTLGDAKSSFTFAGGKLSIPWPEQGQAAVKVVGSGEVGTFGEEKPTPTASVAKIMTAYVILRDHPLKKNEKGPQIEVDDKAVQEGNSESESRIEGLKAGQKFSEQDMLKMLMIPSGNNIARLLARWDTQSGNEAAFVKKMNDAAKDLGMSKTTYTDPSGLDAKTVSTAVDQLKLAEAVMKFDAFRPIVAMPNAEIPGLPGRINNNNDDLLLAGLSIKGIKTGSSSPAGGTLSWAAYKTVDGKDRLILGTMMAQHFKGLDPNASNSLTMVKKNSKKVIETVRSALTSAKAVTKGQVVGYVDDGLGGQTPVVATQDLSAVGVPGQQLQLSLGDGGKAIGHEAKAGTVVGELTVGNGESQQKVPVALKSDLTKPSFGAKLTRLG